MNSFLTFIEKDHYTLAIKSIEIEKNSYSSNNIIIPPSIKNLQRQAEWRASRSMAHRLAPNTKISNNIYGAPILSNGKAISISHSQSLCAVIIGQKRVAIDIEEITERAKKLSAKFLSEEEIGFAEDITRATICWSVKECLFKIHQKGKLDFKKDLKIIKIQDNLVTASLLNSEYQLRFEIIKDHVLVYYFD